MPDRTELMEFINENAPDEEHLDNEYIGKPAWENFLNEHHSGWKNLIKDPKNWKSIEELHPPDGRSSLFNLLLEKAGAGLARRFFHSKDEMCRDCALKWLKSFTEEPEFETWEELDVCMKEYVIHYAFDAFPGEPFESYRRYTRSMIGFTWEFWKFYLEYPHPFPIPFDQPPPCHRLVMSLHSKYHNYVHLPRELKTMHYTKWLTE